MKASRSYLLSVALSTLAISTLVVAPAWGHHEGDVALRNIADQIVTGHFHDDEFRARRVFEGLFGNEYVLNQTETPGFDSPGGTWTPGSQLGINILDALREWDGTDFDEISSSLRVSVERSGNSILTPKEAGEFVHGFGVSADTQGAWHKHFNWVMVDSTGAPSGTAYPDGVYLLKLELFSDDAGLANSDPFYLVIAQDEDSSDGGIGGMEQQDAAVAYVESQIVPEPSTAMLAALAGLAGLMIGGFRRAHG